MLCADAEEQLALMLDTAPNDQAARQLQTHLTGCIDCRKLLAHLILVRVLGRIARMQRGKPFLRRWI